VRVYLPSTLPALRRLLDDGVLLPPGGQGLPGYAVTPAVREWYAEGDSEELEYVALSLAARASVRLLDHALTEDPQTSARRVVVVVESEAVEPAPDVDRAAVRVREPVPLRQVQAVHVDAPSAQDDVRAAAESVVAADLGSDDALFSVEQAEGHELQWYATQEIGPLLELS
jgi:hypothetical protein